MRAATFLIVLLTTAPAFAQPGDYASTIREALAEFDAGNFAEARALFLRAHELQPSARTLRGIGMAAFEMRAYVDAVRSLTAALADPRRPLDQGQRAEAQGILDRAASFVGRFTLGVDPPEATILVDGAPASREPDGTLLLQIGPHTVIARAPPRPDATATIDVRGGEQRTIELRLGTTIPPPLSTPEPSGAAPANPPMRELSPGEGEGGGSLRPLLLIGAGALAVAAIAGGVWWGGRAGAVGDCNDPPSGERCTNLGTLEGQRDLAAGTTITLAVGAAAVLVLGLLLDGDGG